MSSSPQPSPTSQPSSPGTAPVTSAKVLVPGDRSMVALLGTRDELLRLVEEAFDASVHVRGNEISVTGH
ncbi:MAG: PhoH family protein, partial [Actinomycetota bacterium]|nr:PhoH family protein [Actinomycetota bacterium]